ncbi:MAG TPA: riboflavin synthase [Thermoanaerobaculia bacterium]
MIESVGRIAEIEEIDGGVRLRVATELSAVLGLGDSLATNGVCLTVTDVRSPATAVAMGGPSNHGTATPDTALGDVAFDVSPETLRVTTLGDLQPFTLVNLERPMAADGRFGGHLVQGHVDATGSIAALEKDGEFYWLTVAFPRELAPYFIAKGSVAVDGISLTIADLQQDRFKIQIIPHTWQHTNLQGARPGTRVNLECDLVGKYVMRAIQVRTHGS